MTSQVF